MFEERERFGACLQGRNTWIVAVSASPKYQGVIAVVALPCVLELTLFSFGRNSTCVTIVPK
jgi:hypothetical protein